MNNSERGLLYSTNGMAFQCMAHNLPTLCAIPVLLMSFVSLSIGGFYLYIAIRDLRAKA